MFFRIHSLIGTSAALYILLVTVSGIILLFDDEIGELTCATPKLAPQELTASIDDIVHDVEQNFPGNSVTGISFLPDKTQPIDVFATKDGNNWIHCLADPYTGKSLGLKKENAWIELVRDLHFNLMLGSNGRKINAAGAACILMLVATGIAVILPNWNKVWRQPGKKQSVSPASRKWTSHSLLGTFVFPFLIMQSISGIYFCFPTFLQKSLNAIAPVSSQKPASKTVSIAANKTTVRTTPQVALNQKSNTRIDQLIAKAKSHIKPDSAIERIALPNKFDNTVQIWLVNDDSKGEVVGKTKICMSPTTGEVISLYPAESPAPGDKIIQWLISFHSGTLFGETSKWSWLLLGATLPILAITGNRMVMNRRKIQSPKTEIADKRI